MIRSAIALLLSIPLFGGELERYEFAQPHMGTLFRITLYSSQPDTARSAAQAAFERVRQLDYTFSDYIPSSEVMRVCSEAWRTPVRVSPDLFRILAAAKQLSEQTDGAFDVTQGNVIRLWRTARQSGRTPTAKQIAEAKRSSGYHKLVLDAAKRTVFLESEAMHIDLGGIGKGYAADEALRVLRDHGISRALVAASGDLAVGDPPPDRDGWRVRIENGGEPRILELKNVGISTSGDAEQFVEIDGARYSHIISPESGKGLTSGIGVTVLAPDATTSDSLATAVSILGADLGNALIKSILGTTAWIHERSF